MKSQRDDKFSLLRMMTQDCFASQEQLLTPPTQFLQVNEIACCPTLLLLLLVMLVTPVTLTFSPQIASIHQTQWRKSHLGTVFNALLYLARFILSARECNVEECISGSSSSMSSPLHSLSLSLSLR